MTCLVLPCAKQEVGGRERQKYAEKSMEKTC